MIKEEDKKLGELLVKRDIITPEQLVEVLKFKKQHDQELIHILIQKGMANSKELFVCLADYHSVPFIELQDYSIDPEVLEIVPKELAYKYKVFPLFKIEGNLMVTMVNPGNVHVIDTLHRETGYDIEPAVSPEKDILDALESHYGLSDELNYSYDEVIENIEAEKPKEEETTSAEKLKQLSAEAPVVKLVNLIITQAVLDRASDIHIEPEEKSLRVRYRIDGILHETLSPPKHLQAAIISRIKILAELDIAESRIPQDGRFQITLNDRQIDLRVSTLPTVYGENVVLRILDKSSLMLNLEELGFAEDLLKEFEEMLSCSYGIILVSGPTGSGKTTTLYSALQSINTPDKNIVTIEDPVEYRLNLIRQSQVNVKSGLTFAAGLRSILRQDPDVVMVGEIRDSETAKIAVEAALTGHLVLSTIHTNDAPGGLTRLTEMGVEPFLTGSATIGIVAQRLVRKLCDNCKKPYKPNPTIFNEIGLRLNKSNNVFYHREGCKNCKNTGYKGRIGIYEVLEISPKISKLIIKKANNDELFTAARKEGMLTMVEDGFLKAKAGTTTIEEIIRVTKE
ncbi:MAG: GspE/PulE family protein [bacterium]